LSSPSFYLSSAGILVILKVIPVLYCHYRCCCCCGGDDLKQYNYLNYNYNYQYNSHHVPIL